MTRKKKHLDKHSDLNAMRVELALLKQSSIEKIPPSLPAFIQHLKRCNWQAFIWYNAHIPLITIPEPTEYGWQLCEGQLTPIYFDGPTSLEILQQYMCDCSSRSSSCTTIVSVPRCQSTICSKICKCCAKCGNTGDQDQEDD